MVLCQGRSKLRTIGSWDMWSELWRVSRRFGKSACSGAGLIGDRDWCRGWQMDGKLVAESIGEGLMGLIRKRAKRSDGIGGRLVGIIKIWGWKRIEKRRVCMVWRVKVLKVWAKASHQSKATDCKTWDIFKHLLPSPTHWMHILKSAKIMKETFEDCHLALSSQTVPASNYPLTKFNPKSPSSSSLLHHKTKKRLLADLKNLKSMRLNSKMIKQNKHKIRKKTP